MILLRRFLEKKIKWSSNYLNSNAMAKKLFVMVNEVGDGIKVKSF